jgi:hypothetical protein
MERHQTNLTHVVNLQRNVIMDQRQILRDHQEAMLAQWELFQKAVILIVYLCGALISVSVLQASRIHPSNFAFGEAYDSGQSLVSIVEQSSFTNSRDCIFYLCFGLESCFHRRETTITPAHLIPSFLVLRSSTFSSISPCF